MERPAEATFRPEATQYGGVCNLAATLRPLQPQAVTVSFERNADIFVQDAPALHCYLVVRGCVRTVTLMEDGRRQVGEFLLPGDLFGWDTLDHHDFSAEAVTPVVARRYARATLEALADRDREVARQLRDLTAAQLRTARERMMLLGRKTASERIATFLLEMSGRIAINADGRIDLPMSRTDMADHLGLTIETVCRGLTELRRLGTIDIDRASIAILDRRALGTTGFKILH
jgi:CRP/FNR family nitrogen fixation transcriptional regulator